MALAFKAAVAAAQATHKLLLLVALGEPLAVVVAAALHPMVLILELAVTAAMDIALFTHGENYELKIRNYRRRNSRKRCNGFC